MPNICKKMPIFVSGTCTNFLYSNAKYCINCTKISRRSSIISVCVFNFMRSNIPVSIQKFCTLLLTERQVIHLWYQCLNYVTKFLLQCCKTDNRFSGSEQFGTTILTKALKTVTRKAILKRISGSIFGFIIGDNFENNFWDNLGDNFLNIFGDFWNPEMWKFWLLQGISHWNGLYELALTERNM